MATVIFYEKPGCINNTQQKKWLTQSGHTVDSRDLLKTNWSAIELRRYFGSEEIENWFNPAAPQIKVGKIDVYSVAEADALSMMIENPILIRRPLMRVGDDYRIGFDRREVHAWIGLDSQILDHYDELEGCPRIG